MAADQDTRYAGLIAGLVLALCLAGPTGASSRPELRFGVIRARTATVYSDSNLLTSPLRRANRDDVFALLESPNNWCRVQLSDDQVGWMPTRELLISSDREAALSGRFRAQHEAWASTGEFLGALAAGTAWSAAIMASYLPALQWGSAWVFSAPGNGSRGASRTTYQVLLVGAAAASIVEPAVAALGCHLVGNRNDPGGSFWWSCLGGEAGQLVGGLATFGALYASNRLGPNYSPGWVPFVLTPVCTALGAALAYQPNRANLPHIWKQLTTPKPGVSLRCIGDRPPEPVLDLRLAGLQF